MRCCKERGSESSEDRGGGVPYRGWGSSVCVCVGGGGGGVTIKLSRLNTMYSLV